MLKAALNAVTALHSRSAMLKRLGTPDIYSPCKITPSNYFRFLRGPEYMTVKGREFIIPIDSMTGQFSQLLTFDQIPGYGQFKLKFGSNTTEFLDFDATAVDIQDALREFEPLENVLVTGSFVTGFRIVFQGFSVRPALGEVVSSTLSVDPPSPPPEVPVVWSNLQGNINSTGEILNKVGGSDNWGENIAYSDDVFLNTPVEYLMAVENCVGSMSLGTVTSLTGTEFEQHYTVGRFNPGGGDQIWVFEESLTTNLNIFIVPGDVLSLKVENDGTVTARLNGAVIHTFSVPATGRSLVPIAAIWQANGTLNQTARLIDPNATGEESEPVTAAWKNTSVAWTERIKKGDRIVEGESILTVDEIIEMHDLGAQVMAYRVRCD